VRDEQRCTGPERRVLHVIERIALAGGQGVEKQGPLRGQGAQGAVVHGNGPARLRWIAFGPGRGHELLQKVGRASAQVFAPGLALPVPLRGPEDFGARQRGLGPAPGGEPGFQAGARQFLLPLRRQQRRIPPGPGRVMGRVLRQGAQIAQFALLEQRGRHRHGPGAGCQGHEHQQQNREERGVRAGQMRDGRHGNSIGSDRNGNSGASALSSPSLRRRARKV